MHAIVPTPLHMALQETWTASLLLDQLPRSHAVPVGQNPLQNGLAGVKICARHRGTVMGRNTAGLDGHTRTGSSAANRGAVKL